MIENFFRHEADYAGVTEEVREMIGEGYTNEEILEHLHSTSFALRYELWSVEMESELLNIIREILKGESQ